MQKTLIVGLGYVGSALAARLARAGHDVWGMRRRRWQPPPGLTAVTADVTRPDTLDRLPGGLDFVVYAVSSGASTEQAYRAAYVEGLANLIRAVAESSPALRRVVFVSSTAVYGQDDGAWVDERSSTVPTRFQGKVLLEGEAELASSGFPHTVVRLGGIYGPGRARVLDSVRDGRAECVEGMMQYTNRIHRDDCAGVLEHVLALGATDAPELLLGVDREPASRCDVFRWIADRIGAPPPGTVPATGDSTVTGKRCNSASLVASGYAFHHPTFREGYDATIAEWRRI